MPKKCASSGANHGYPAGTNKGAGLLRRRELEIKAYLESKRVDLADISASRLFWLKIAVLVAFCIGLSMSSPLWIGPRSYPLTPISTMIR
jgi:hypothetical protein